MSEDEEFYAKLLSPPHNYAVVQLPERRYPGIVVQGDSFHSLIGDLQEALNEPEDREFLINELIERLKTIQAQYEAVLSKAGIELPYFRS